MSKSKEFLEKLNQRTDGRFKSTGRVQSIMGKLRAEEISGLLNRVTEKMSRILDNNDSSEPNIYEGNKQAFEQVKKNVAECASLLEKMKYK